MKKRAYLFSFIPWAGVCQYLLVYATNEAEARELGAKQCTYNSGAKASPKDLHSLTYGLNF